MYLVFRVSSSAIRFGLFTPEAQTVYEQTTNISSWNPREVSRIFQSDILAQLRAHGKIVTKVGFIVPIADPTHTRPQLAQKTIPALRNMDRLTATLYERIEQVMAQSKKNWPHLPHFWLFDTFMSADIDRATVIPPFQHDVIKQFRIHPYLLEGYAHRSNTQYYKQARPFVSVVIEDVTSIALFAEGKILDVIPAYSYWPSLLGIGSGGVADSGLVSRLYESIGGKRWPDFVEGSMGLRSIIGVSGSLDTLLRLSGLVPRGTSDSLPDISIETLEYIELAMRGFVKSLRAGIAGILTSSLEARTVVVSSSHLSESSGLWKLLNQGSLGHLSIEYNPTSALEPAAKDLSSVWYFACIGSMVR